MVSDDEDSSVNRFVDDGCVSNRTEIDRCHSPVFGEEELNQHSERQSAYGFDGQAAGSRLADDTEIESLVESLQFQQVGKHVVIHDLIGYARPIVLKDSSVLLGLFQEIESRGSECRSRNQNEIAVELYSRCIQSIILHRVHTETDSFSRELSIMYANRCLAHMALRLRYELLQEDEKAKEYWKLGRHDSMHALRFDPLNILAIELVHYTGNKQCSSAEEKLEYLNTVNRVIESTPFDVFSDKDYMTGTEIDLDGGKLLRPPEYWSKFLG